MKKRILTGVIGIVICLTLGTGLLNAQKKAMPGLTAGQISSAAIVRFGSDIRVPEGTTIKGDVVCFLGNIQLDGKVDGNLVSMFGKLSTGKNAAVSGDLVLFMSDQTPAAGLRAAKSQVEFNLPGQKLILKIVSFWFKSLPVNIIIGLISLILLVWFFIRFVLKAIELPAMTRNLSNNAGKAFLYGLLGIIAIKITSLVLALTIILSGTAFVRFCGFLALWRVGYIPVAVWLGEKVSVLFKTKFSGAGHFLAGVLCLAILMFIPALGALTAIVLGVIGFGLLLTQVLGLKLAGK